MTPVIYSGAFFRWLAQKTNEVPIWPAEIEAQCRIEPNDPYLRDRDNLSPKGAWKMPRELKEMIRRNG